MDMLLRLSVKLCYYQWSITCGDEYLEKSSVVFE